MEVIVQAFVVAFDIKRIEAYPYPIMLKKKMETKMQVFEGYAEFESFCPHYAAL